MNEKFMVAAHHLNGQRTAENYIDECVFQTVPEPHVLYQILVKMTGDDMASRAKLMGFADCLHSMLRLGLNDEVIE